jgi:hypothetical protein
MFLFSLSICAIFCFCWSIDAVSSLPGAFFVLFSILPGVLALFLALAWGQPSQL